MKDIQETLIKILANEKVQQTLHFIEQDAEQTLQQQIELAETPAPPFAEKERAIFYKKLLQDAGLEQVRQDDIDNTYGFITQNKGATLLVTAHIDSVFSAETDIIVREENGIYYGAGICDDARGLATVLSAIRALKKSGLTLAGNLIIGGDVGEESQGDLRGMKKLFADYLEIDGYISVDGAAPDAIIYQATGSRRYIFTFTGSGGHSFGDFGRPSSVHAAARAVAKIADIDVPDSPKTTFNVGVIEGGTLPTAIAERCEIKVDIRSNSATALRKYDALVLELVNTAIAEENARSTSQEHHIRLSVECIGDRPAGSQDETENIVQAASSVIEALGMETKLLGASSTDANIPISLGIPAVTIGGGGNAGNAHSLAEWYDPTNAHIGVQQVFLLILLLLGIENEVKGVLQNNN